MMRGYGVLRRLLGEPARDFRQLAVVHQVLAPAETLAYAPPRLPPGHLDRIVAGWEDEPREQVIGRLTRHELTHDATEAYTLHDVALLGDRLYGAGMRHSLHRGRMPWPHEMAIFSEVVMAASYPGSRWFGHLIHDDFPTQLLARELGTPVAQARPPYSEEAAFRQVFGVPSPRIVKGFFACRCTILVDYAQNASKRARYARMRARVERPAHRGKPVYVRRGGGELRRIQEESELVRALEARGFEVLDNRRDSVERMCAVCSQASQIVTVDGSHAAPCVFLAPAGAELLDISPPDRVSDTMIDVAGAAGLLKALYVGRPGASSSRGRAESAGSLTFSVDLPELLRFIDQSPARV